MDSLVFSLILRIQILRGSLFWLKKDSKIYSYIFCKNDIKQLFSTDTSISLRFFFAHENICQKLKIHIRIGLRHFLVSTFNKWLYPRIFLKMYMVEEFSKLTKLISKQLSHCGFKYLIHPKWARLTVLFARKF